MLVGRDRERSQVERLLFDAGEGRSGALLLEGEPGVGKSALLRHAVELAEAMTVVRVTGVEAEAELEFSGLLELCRPLRPDLDALPEAQAAALRSVLGLEAARSRDRFSIGAATLALLAAAAERSPLLVVVDDAQWLDAASTDALCFAARRLVADRVALVAAARAGEARSFVAAGFQRLSLGGLDRAAAAQLVRRPGAEVSSAVVEELVALTDGNALALSEIGRVLTEAQLAGGEPLPDPLPIGVDLESAYARRLQTLPPATRSALVLLAMAGDDGIEAVARSLEYLGSDMSALDPAEDAGLVSVGPDGAAFVHPLMRSTVARTSGPSDRRAAHRALAVALAETGQSERRAWHLAAAAVGPDAEAAEALAEAAESARARTGFAASAQAFERAARLTPDASLRRERLAAAAEAAFAGGHPDRATELAAEALAGCEDATARARLLRLMGQVELQAGKQHRARELLVAAADEAEPVDPVMAVGSLSLAVFSCHFAGRIGEALELSTRCRAIAPDDGGEGDLHSRYVMGRSLVLAGLDAEGRQILDQLLGTWLAIPEQPRIMLARTAIALAAVERLEEAVQVSARVERAARDEGPAALTYALTLVAECASRAGRWRDAERAATEGLALAREVRLENIAAHELAVLARIAAARGDRETCSEHAEEALATLEASEMALPATQVRCTLGLLELGLGELDAAVAILEPTAAATVQMGLVDPDVCPAPDLVEALVRLGDVGKARDALEAWRSSVPQAARWIRARAKRCEGLVADGAAYERCFVESLELDTGADPLALARTRLCFGERLRRTGRRVDARRELRSALETFERLGATPWVDRVGRELRATGEKIGRRRAESGDDLTAQELQIALQVAEGKQNKEVAATLFLSPKTVEFHLSRIYRKLDITSRSELVRRFATEVVVGTAG